MGLKMQANITIRKKDNGYQVIVSYKDGRRWRQKSKQGFKTQRAAKEYGQDIIAELKETVSVFASEDLRDATLGGFYSLYLREKSNLTYNTRLTYEHSLRFFHELAPLPIRNISYSQIVSVFNSGYLSPGTRNLYLQRLKTVFNYAKRPYGAITLNPCDLVEKAKSERRKIRVFTEDELDKLMNFLKGYSLYYYTLVAVARYTGCRYSEILGLTWDDIDFSGATININKQFVRSGQNKFGFNRLKTKNSYRILPVPPVLLKILKDYKKQRDGLILFPAKGNHSSRVNNVIWTVISGKSIHDMRHTYATTLLANGLDVKTVASLLGDDVNTVINTYIHFTDEMRLRAADRVANIFK